jgi:hypothetical protein
LFDKNKLSILNFHSLTGVGYKNAKGSNFASIAEFLHSKIDLDFFCCDANEPKIDSFESDKLEFWEHNGRGRFASLIFGNDKVHQLIDAVTSSPEIFKELPVSYYTRNIPRRYDHIYRSDKWTTKKLIFDYDNSKSANSDHAILVGDFEERQ